MLENFINQFINVMNNDYFFQTMISNNINFIDYINNEYIINEVNLNIIKESSNNIIKENIEIIKENDSNTVLGNISDWLKMHNASQYFKYLCGILLLFIVGYLILGIYIYMDRPSDSELKDLIIEGLRSRPNYNGDADSDTFNAIVNKILIKLKRILDKEGFCTNDEIRGFIVDIINAHINRYRK